MARLGARPDDWKTTPLPAAIARLSYPREFSTDEFARLQQGILPEAMEDKWFVVWHDDALWFHRSWTGLCIYRLRFETRDDRFVVVEVLVNRDPEQYSGRDADDLRLDELVSSLFELPRAPVPTRSFGSLLRDLITAWTRR